MKGLSFTLAIRDVQITCGLCKDDDVAIRKILTTLVRSGGQGEGGKGERLL